MADIETWHSAFHPDSFLKRVDLSKLLERNATFNEKIAVDSARICALCETSQRFGIWLSDKSFLCTDCYEVVATIQYPEIYEQARRKHLVRSEAWRLAWSEFRRTYEVAPSSNSAIAWGWISMILGFINPVLLVGSGLILVIGYAQGALTSRKVSAWRQMESEWQRANPEPKLPPLKHFHDASVELTQRDRLILRIFEHWPGYPPFWNYLRQVVLTSDGHRCQVTGCPSRLELHIHHIKPISEGGAHVPSNLVSLCDFHHALEPEPGHERIWNAIKTRYFTLVQQHERSNRVAPGSHLVRPYLRRLQLVTNKEIEDLIETFGLCCPSCMTRSLRSEVQARSQSVRVACMTCGGSSTGPQLLAEETGPLLAEGLPATLNPRRWRARWDVLAERTSSIWRLYT
jgi:5-methylcytosine-specific restriction endonuclease McrA